MGDEDEKLVYVCKDVPMGCPGKTDPLHALELLQNSLATDG